MNKISPYVVGKSDRISFDFTYTKKNENVVKTGKIFLAKDGTLYGDKSYNGSFITIEGGDDTAAHTKANVYVSPFYITTNQRITIMNILKATASYSDDATVESSNSDLQDMILAIYNNFNG